MGRVSKKRKIIPNPKNKSGCYLEIYVKEDGSLVLTPITNNTSAVIEALTVKNKNQIKPLNTYCG